ncbi:MULTISPECIES: hypothetical protein [Rhodomicrobium]|uniref:hypothetical protein n=1 Tax=Rhodomicrobium TaxID=1068 RepID=UPI000B4BFEB8|nr:MULTISPECIES: hypothetical protein [Rhodomicrobium]
MVSTVRLLRNLAIASLLGGSVALGGCAGGVGVDVDAPILDAVGINFTAKKKDDDDLPERTGLVVPPSTDKLPEPGTHTASINGKQNWPQDADQIKKRKADEETAAQEKYCAEGDWSKKANITEFEKNVGREARCPSKLGKAISKNLNSKDQVEQQQ